MADPEAPQVVENEVKQENEEEVDGTIETPGHQAGQLNEIMKNPMFLAAVQGKLGSMVGQPSGYIDSLPKEVKRRIKALKKLQFEMTKIEAKFFEEVHELECRYAAKYRPLMDRRKDIVLGGTEPTDSDCEWPSDSEEDDEDKDQDELAKDVKKKVAITESGDAAEVEKENSENEEPKEPVSGIPEFWLTIFKNVDMLCDMIQDHDEPILKHLQDVRVKFSEHELMGFTIEFYFSANEYFNNAVLTKHYTMNSEPDEDDPLSFDGPEIVKCTGCTIDWKKDKNVTVKTIKKKQKHKGRGVTRMVTKTIQNDSFFNFFNPPVAPEPEEDEDEETETILAADYEIGHFLRERIVPRAVLYFTGEALDDDDEYEEEAADEADEGEEDEENDPDYNPQTDGNKPQECKQQ